MPGLYTGANGLGGGFSGLLYGPASLSTPPGLLADAAGFSPASLFAAGEKGAWYDPFDFSTMFQDSAGTIPVTDVEQPVGRINDKSGQGNHATQSADLSRPILRRTTSGLYHLAFNGSNNFLVTPPLNLSATAQVSTVAGIQKSTDTAGIISEGGASINIGSGKFSLRTDASPDFSFISRGSINSSTSSVSTYAIPATVVLTGLGDIVNDLSTLRINGAQVSQSTTDQGTGTTYNGSNIYYIGMRAGTSVALNGRIYGLIILNRSFTAEELANTESWMNARTKAY